MELVALGLLVGFATLIHFFKMGIKRVAGYDLYIDLFLTWLLMMLFHGTQAGMVIAIIGGLMISVMLRVLRWGIGYQRLGVYKCKYKLAPFFTVNAPRLVWYEYPPLRAWPKGLEPKDARYPIM